MFWQNFIKLCAERGLSPNAVARELSISSGAVTKWKNGTFPQNSTMKKIANYFNVPISFFEGIISNNTIPNADVIEGNIYNIPVFESVSAGFGAYPDNHIVSYIPMIFSSATEANESIFVVVRGDSMYPKIEDGDTVLVLKQSIADSGAIAVVLIDGEDALVKRVVYGENWIELQSINPMYPPIRFAGQDVLRVQLLGIVKKILKNA